MSLQRFLFTMCYESLFILQKSYIECVQCLIYSAFSEEMFLFFDLDWFLGLMRSSW